MARTSTKGRINQRLRTRKAILEAAGQLLKEGRPLSMEEVAEQALVSRATVYRYFPSLDAVMMEATLDLAVPDPRELFADDESKDAAERVDRAEAALHEMMYQNENQLRVFMIQALKQRLEGMNENIPVRQNRRIPLIRTALAPVLDGMDEDLQEKLCSSLALFFGIESMIVFTDVVPLSEQRARSVKSWALQSLVNAALAESCQK